MAVSLVHQVHCQLRRDLHTPRPQGAQEDLPGEVPAGAAGQPGEAEV